MWLVNAPGVMKLLSMILYDMYAVHMDKQYETCYDFTSNDHDINDQMVQGTCSKW